MSNSLLIETKNLSKVYSGRKVVNDLNLSVEAGDIYGFLGPNGSGKTTTIRMLMGLVHPGEGEIFINGYNIKNQFIEAISEVGAIVEGPSFYSYLSAYDNLKLMANYYNNVKKERIEEVLEIVNLKDRAKDKVKTYSLGMKQRLGIAMSLLNKPKLVILDEPTNGLDPQGIKDMRELISGLSKSHNITFFISSHLLNEIEQVCSKVGIIKNGCLLAQGDVKELLTTKFEQFEVSTLEREKTASILRNEKFVMSVESSENGVIVEIEKGTFSKLNQILINSNIEVNLLTKLSNSLEKVFFDITEEGQNVKSC